MLTPLLCDAGSQRRLDALPGPFRYATLALSVVWMPCLDLFAMRRWLSASSGCPAWAFSLCDAGSQRRLLIIDFACCLSTSNVCCPQQTYASLLGFQAGHPVFVLDLFADAGSQRCLAVMPTSYTYGAGNMLQGVQPWKWGSS